MSSSYLSSSNELIIFWVYIILRKLQNLLKKAQKKRVGKIYWERIHKEIEIRCLTSELQHSCPKYKFHSQSEKESSRLFQCKGGGCCCAYISSILHRFTRSKLVRHLLSQFWKQSWLCLLIYIKYLKKIIMFF